MEETDMVETIPLGLEANPVSVRVGAVRYPDDGASSDELSGVHGAGTFAASAGPDGTLELDLRF